MLENNVYKLNINNYIGKEIINAKYNSDNIYVNVISKNIYMDYEVYDITITNNTGKTIKLDSQEKTKTIYALDDNNVRYIECNSEYIDEELVINNVQTKKLKIKFNKNYSTKNKIIKILFSDVILNYEEYCQNNNLAKRKSIHVEF